MSGDRWQQFANLRALFGYMYGSAGKKLLFMGGELAQWPEWSHDAGVDWDSLDDEMHRGVQAWVRDLNHAYRERPALHKGDADPGGFNWITLQDAVASVLAWERWDPASGDVVVCLAHLTPAPRDGYHVGVPKGGTWEVLLHSDDPKYGGSGGSIPTDIEATDDPLHERGHRLSIDLPPLGIVFLAPKS